MPKRTNDGIKKRCDCGRRKWAKCPHPWHFSFHHGGVEHRYSLDKIASARGERPPTSKGEASTWRDRLRNEIRAGAFLNPDAPAAAAAAHMRLTFGDVCDRYLAAHVRVSTRRPRAREEMEYHVRALRRASVPAAGGRSLPLETKPIDAVTQADVEAIRDARRADVDRARTELEVWRAAAEQATREGRTVPSKPAVRVPGPKGGAVGTNRLLARLRHIFGWAIEKGITMETPFKRHGRTVIHLEASVEKPRHRRLDPGEEERLLQHAGAHLHALIVAALESGLRRGELLGLRWSHLHCDERGVPRWIVLPASLTKTNETRSIPVSTRLRAVLEMRHDAPDGTAHPPQAHVFGNEIGEPVQSIKTAWKLTCQRAAIRDLHFHDLRREFACRLLESPGVSGHEVRDWLGHDNITTTDRYLSTTPSHLLAALHKFEDARRIRTTFAHTADSADKRTQAALAESDVNLLN